MKPAKGFGCTDAKGVGLVLHILVRVDFFEQEREVFLGKERMFTFKLSRAGMAVEWRSKAFIA